MKVSNFRELRIRQAAMQLAETTYTVTRSFPREEAFGLTAQMRRSAVSVPSNIAEGHIRASRRDFLRYLPIAEASLAELETQIELAARIGFISPHNTKNLIQGSRALGRQIHATKSALARLKRHPSAVRRPPSAETRSDESQSPTTRRDR